MEKLTIEKAREIISIPRSFCTDPIDYINAKAFVAGWESRQAEVTQLKQQNEKMREALEEIRKKPCTCFSACGPCFDSLSNIAEEALKEESK
jgi:hypothetical protein